MQIEQKPNKKDDLMVANSVLKLAADLLKVCFMHLVSILRTISILLITINILRFKIYLNI